MRGVPESGNMSRPRDPGAEDAGEYDMTRREIRRITIARWKQMPDLAKRVIANDLIRTREAVRKGQNG